MRHARIHSGPQRVVVLVLLVLAVLGFEGSQVHAQTSKSWQAQNIYQIITDRFYDGDPSNNNADGNYNPAGHRGTSVHGGDFKGIEDKLGYLESLGATAIWISPIVLNARGEFHGYAGRDFYRVDPHWGSMDDLKHLVAAAHARGIRVIDDIVVNHGGDLVNSGDPGYGRFKPPPGGYTLRFRNAAVQYPPPFDLNATNPSLTNLFHNNGEIQDYNNEQQVVLGELAGLDDFRTESPYVRERMKEIYEFWIEQAGFDGFRIDTVRHVEMGFWQTWCPAIHTFAAAHGKPDFFMFGEALVNSDAKVGSYTGTKAGGDFALDSMLDYPLYFAINPVFARGTESPRRIVDHYNTISSCYDPSAQMRLVTFLDNHDQARFLSPENASNDVVRLQTALVFLYTSRGIPSLYYGTEQGFNGRTDPYDREDMFAGKFEQGPSLGDNFNMTHPLFQWVARLNNFRRLYPALSLGAQSNLWMEAKGPGLLAYSRTLGDQELIVVVNTATTERELPELSTSAPPGTLLVDLLAPAETNAVTQSRRIPSLTVPGKASKILIAQSQVQPLDPTVVSVTPAHDAQNVPCQSPILFRFSEPMVPASVEAAFSITPPIQGSLTLSSNRSQATFTPATPFPTNQMIFVRLSSAAKSAISGTTLHGGFEARFETAAEPTPK